MDKIRKQKGFTLMEMLIVVAIIAVLVAIAIPTFSKSLEKSRRAVDMATARDIMAVFAAQINDGTIELNDESSTIWVEVHRGTILYGKGTADNSEFSDQVPTYNGTIISTGKRDSIFSQKILPSGGLTPDGIRVHAKDASNGGWGWYAVYARGNGSIGVVSGPETDDGRKIANNNYLNSFIGNQRYSNLQKAMGR